MKELNQRAMNINLKLKRPQAAQCALMFDFRKNKQYYKLYPGITILTKNWSTKGYIKKDEDNSDLLNDYLENWKTELKRIITEMDIKGQRLNQKEIQEKLNLVFQKNIKVEKNETAVVDFTSFMESFIQMKKGDGKFLQKLEQAQKTVLIAFDLISKKKLSEYNLLSNKAKSNIVLKADYTLPFKEINFQFLQKFKSFLNKSTYSLRENGKNIEKNYTTNYIDKQINGLKQFVNGAIESKYVEYFTWDSLKSNGTEVDTVHTDFKEILAIHDVSLDKENEIKIRDKYVINCFLGFRYSDLNVLEPHVFKKSMIKGVEYIVYQGRSKKTGELIEFPVHGIAATLLEKYDYQIPKYSAKEFNEIIKIVAKKAGLTQLIRIKETRAGKPKIMDIPKYELICSHTGRRSFCTNFYVEGVGIPIIMSISGHKTEKEFMKYIKKRSVRIEVAAEQISAIKTLDVLRVA